MKILPAVTVALALAVAYLIGAGDQPTTAVGTVAPAAVASIPTAAPAAPVVPVAAAAPRSAEEATALSALLAAEDELAERSATVVARATERAGQKTTTPAKVAPVKGRAKTASATTPAKAEQKAEKAAAKAEKAPSNEELAYRIDQVAEDTCERRAGGVVAEDYTCVGADFYGKPAAPKVKAQGKATNTDTVPLGEGKTRCPSGYSRDKADRGLCVAKS